MGKRCEDHAAAGTRQSRLSYRTGGRCEKVRRKRYQQIWRRSERHVLLPCHALPGKFKIENLYGRTIGFRGSHRFLQRPGRRGQLCGAIQLWSALRFPVFQAQRLFAGKTGSKFYLLLRAFLRKPVGTIGA